MNVAFFSESQSDLVDSVSNIIYFRAFRDGADAMTPFELTGATLYAYDPLLPAIPIEIVQENVSTTKGGFGVLDEIIIDDSKVYFLEYQFEDWTPSNGYETMEQYFYPTEERVVLEDGTMRFPLVIEGIQ